MQYNNPEELFVAARFCSSTGQAANNSSGLLV